LTNFVNDIAKVNKKHRFDAIIKVLKENHIPYEIENFVCGKVPGQNIIANKNNSENKIVVSAHYDNYYGTPGANDNASACSILLNLILNNKKDDIEYVFFDFEESRFAGSRIYLNYHKKNIKFAINLDMCGMGENIVVSKHFIKNTNLDKLCSKHNCKEVEQLPPGDIESFKDRRIPCMFVVNSTNHDLDWYLQYSNRIRPYISADFLETMHQPNDTVDTINLTQIEKIYDFVKEVSESFE